MVTKKSPRYSLENKKSISVMMGLIMVLSLLFISFEWSKEEFEINQIVQPGVEDFVEYYLPNILPEKPLPPPPPVSKKITDIIKVVDNNSAIPKNEPVENNSNTNNTQAKDINTQSFKTEGEVVEFVYVTDKMPEFKGDVFEYLSKNLNYPIIALEMGIQGRVICQFIVDKDGSIVDAKVIKSIDKYLDQEALRVINSMPKWTPGSMNGKLVRVKYTFPVRFSLN